jgi:hypothetical protein
MTSSRYMYLRLYSTLCKKEDTITGDTVSIRVSYNLLKTHGNNPHLRKYKFVNFRRCGYPTRVLVYNPDPYAI